MRTLAILLLSALLAHSEEKKPFGTGMNGEPPAVPYQGTTEYWNQVVALYPDAADQNSAMFGEMVKINKWLEQIKDPVCSLPDKKLRVANMAAAKLGMTPKMAGATKAATGPAANGPLVNPAELVTLITREKAEGGKRKPSGSSRNSKAIYPKGKYAGKTEQDLIAGCIKEFAAKNGYTPIYEEGAPVGGWKDENAKATADAARTAREDAARAETAARNAALIKEANDQRRAEDIKREIRKLE